MTAKEHLDRVEKIIKEHDDILEAIINAQQKVKKYYDETEDEVFKYHYRALNNAYAEVIYSMISMPHVSKLCEIHIAALEEKFREKEFGPTRKIKLEDW